MSGVVDVEFLEEETVLDIELEDSEEFDIDFSETLDTGVYGDSEYEGVYEIVPKVDAQSLPTKEKYLKEDVTIHGVPYFETDNEVGTTVYIASEV